MKFFKLKATNTCNSIVFITFDWVELNIVSSSFISCPWLLGGYWLLTISRWLSWRTREWSNRMSVPLLYLIPASVIRNSSTGQGLIVDLKNGLCIKLQKCHCFVVYRLVYIRNRLHSHSKYWHGGIKLRSFSQGWSPSSSAFGSWMVALFGCVVNESYFGGHPPSKWQFTEYSVALPACELGGGIKNVFN